MANKTNKQEIFEPDKLQIMLGQLRDYMLSHKRNIAIALVVVVATMALATGWIYYRQSEETQAMNLYNQTILNITRLSMTNQAVEPALKPLHDLISKYPSTSAAMLAQYRIANAYLNDNKITEAMKYYESYLKAKTGENEITVLVYNSLGYCHEANKDYKGALNLYEKALQAKAGKPFEGDILAGIARAYEGMKDNKKAFEYYSQALDKTQNPAMKLLLSRKMAILG